MAYSANLMNGDETLGRPRKAFIDKFLLSQETDGKHDKIYDKNYLWRSIRVIKYFYMGETAVREQLYRLQLKS